MAGGTTELNSAFLCGRDVNSKTDWWLATMHFDLVQCRGCAVLGKGRAYGGHWSVLSVFVFI